MTIKICQASIINTFVNYFLVTETYSIVSLYAEFSG